MVRLGHLHRRRHDRGRGNQCGQPVPAFHDITIGTNRYYPATRGWDFATGLGSPAVANLAHDVVSYLKR
jgi:hypothetical protein